MQGRALQPGTRTAVRAAVDPALITRVKKKTIVNKSLIDWKEWSDGIKSKNRNASSITAIPVGGGRDSDE